MEGDLPGDMAIVPYVETTPPPRRPIVAANDVVDIEAELDVFAAICQKAITRSGAETAG